MRRRRRFLRSGGSVALGDCLNRPTGKMLVTGEVTEEELYAAFKEQAMALARAGHGRCASRTMSAADEAALAIRGGARETRIARKSSAPSPFNGAPKASSAR